MVLKGRSKDARSEDEISQAVYSDPGANACRCHVSIYFRVSCTCILDYYILLNILLSSLLVELFLNLQGIDAFCFPCMDIVSVNVLCISLYPVSAGTNGATNTLAESRVTLPFQPLSLCFNHVNYYVDMPAVSKYIKT